MEDHEDLTKGAVALTDTHNTHVLNEDMTDLKSFDTSNDIVNNDHDIVNNDHEINHKDDHIENFQTNGISGKNIEEKESATVLNSIEIVCNDLDKVDEQFSKDENNKDAEYLESKKESDSSLIEDSVDKYNANNETLDILGKTPDEEAVEVVSKSEIEVHETMEEVKILADNEELTKTTTNVTSTTIITETEMLVEDLSENKEVDSSEDLKLELEDSLPGENLGTNEVTQEGKDNFEDNELNSTDELESIRQECAKNQDNIVTSINEMVETVSEKQRNVIQDIFDDWQDEAGEEEVSSRPTDAVELELKNLLDEGKPVESVEERLITIEVIEQDGKVHSISTEKEIDITKLSSMEKLQTVVSNPSDDPENKSCGEIVASLLKEGSLPVKTTMKLLNIPKEKAETKGTASAVTKPHTKGRLMTGQLSSPAVTQVMKERIREKQKSLEPPVGVDVMFVKKLTQRLSSKLAAVPPSNVAISSMDTEITNTNSTSVTSSSQKNIHSDNKELLAILEGEPDPDWSNVKSSSEEESAPSSNKGTNPLEREIALKQLLELPGTPMKKKRRIKTKNTDDESNMKQENKSKAKERQSTSQNPEANNSQKKTAEDTSSSPERRVEESRSGRKRKLTEKAREHEQSFNQKRQKRSKGRPPLHGRRSNENMPTKRIEEKLNSPVKKSEEKMSSTKNATSESDVPNEDTKNKTRVSSEKSEPITSLSKKSISQDQEIPKKKKNVKSKPVSAVTKPKRTVTGRSKEIEKLLQDEGVVNILYDVEQTDRHRRLIPITKSHAKVMDLEKAERELKQRQKLVRDAVLNTSGTSNIMSRSKRSITHSEKVEKTDKKSEPTKEKAVASNELVITPSHRNAEESVIFRRHSTSSYSSAPGSPRVFVHDIVESENYESFIKKDSLPRKGIKRNLSASKENANEKKKKEEDEDDDDDDDADANADDDDNGDDNDDNNEESSSDVSEDEKESKKIGKKLQKEGEKKKVVTRSTSPRAGSLITRKRGREVAKVPKVQSAVKSNSTNQNKKIQDALSVVLAETASALSNVTGSTGRPSSSLRKNRGGNAASKKLPEELIFSNKEINVRRCGKLVQLTLTPSSSSKLRNGINQQMMQEFGEVLSILKTDKECHGVILTSTGTSFCDGLEIETLLHEDKEVRRKRAEDMANGVKDFIRSLAHFDKPIVAGVQGAAVGLGVTMLPLFDLVIASDKATFSTPYGKLGQIPEGLSVISLSQTLGTAFVNELLIGGKTMTANEALTAGLVTRILWPDRFQAELFPSLKTMSDYSLQSTTTTKSLLRQDLRKKLDGALDTESKMLVEQWCSEECQDRIKAYLEEQIQ